MQCCLRGIDNMSQKLIVVIYITKVNFCDVCLVKRGGGGTCILWVGFDFYDTPCSFPYWIDRSTCQVSRMSLGTGFLTSSCFIWFYLEISRSKTSLVWLMMILQFRCTRALLFHTDNHQTRVLLEDVGLTLR